MHRGLGSLHELSPTLRLHRLGRVSRSGQRGLTECQQQIKKHPRDRKFIQQKSGRGEQIVAATAGETDFVKTHERQRNRFEFRLGVGRHQRVPLFRDFLLRNALPIEGNPMRIAFVRLANGDAID